MARGAGWTLLNLALLYVHIGLALAALLIVTRRNAFPKLKVLRVYLAYIVVAGILGYAAALFGSAVTYGLVYWTVNLVHDVLLCFVTVELIVLLVPTRLAAPWSMAFLTVLAMVYVKALPDFRLDPLLNLSIAGDLTAMIILGALLFVSDVQWEGYATMPIAILLFVLGNALPAVEWLHGLSGTALHVMVQGGTMGGLLFMIWTGWEWEGK